MPLQIPVPISSTGIVNLFNKAKTNFEDIYTVSCVNEVECSTLCIQFFSAISGRKSYCWFTEMLLLIKNHSTAWSPEVIFPDHSFIANALSPTTTMRISNSLPGYVILKINISPLTAPYPGVRRRNHKSDKSPPGYPVNQFSQAWTSAIVLWDFQVHNTQGILCQTPFGPFCLLLLGSLPSWHSAILRRLSA